MFNNFIIANVEKRLPKISQYISGFSNAVLIIFKLDFYPSLAIFDKCSFKQIAEEKKQTNPHTTQKNLNDASSSASVRLFVRFPAYNVLFV